jgi:hypothetical protein
MILRRGSWRYDSSLYPASKLPRENVIAFENALAFAEEFAPAAERGAGGTIRAPYDPKSPHDAITRRGT